MTDHESGVEAAMKAVAASRFSGNPEAYRGIVETAISAYIEAGGFAVHASKPVVEAVKVKPLEWRRSGWVEGFAQPDGLGVWYSIQPDKPVHGPGDPPFTCNAIWGGPGQNRRECLGLDFKSLDEAKAAAQADYEQRVMSALSTPPQPETQGEPITLTYTNWRGETAERAILPKRVWFGSTDWHPEPQWLLTAIDCDKQAERDFALKDFGPAALPNEPEAKP